MVELHQPISHDLRHDRRATDDITALVPMDNRLTRNRRGRRHGAIHENQVSRLWQIMNGLLHGPERRAEDIVPINLLGAHNPNSHLRPLEDDVKGSSALTSGELF